MDGSTSAVKVAHPVNPAIIGSMNIEWRSILEFPDYEVSNTGTVRRVRISTQSPRKYTSLPYTIKSRIAGMGYPMVSFHKNGRRYTRTVHALVAAAFSGPRS